MELENPVLSPECDLVPVPVPPESSPLARALWNTRISQRDLARAIRVSQSLVSQWVAGEKPVSPEKCVAIERVTQGRIKRVHLRPELFGRLKFR